MYRGHTSSNQHKKPGGQSAKNISLLLENILACHIGPDQGAAEVIVRASLADPSRPSDRYHGTTDTYGNDTKYIQRKHDLARRNTTLPVDAATYKDYTD